MASFPIRAAFTFAFAVSFAALSGCGGGPKKPANTAGASSESGGNSGPAEVGKPAPDLSLTTVNGKGKISLESLQGKVTIVDFWATWCAPCKQSFPKLEELSKQNPDKLQIVGVAVDDQVDGVADFAKQNGATFAIGWDDGHSIANRWKVDTMPTTYVLDTTGKVRFIHAGYHDDEAQKLAKEVASLASESGGSSSTVAKSDTPSTTSGETSSETKTETKPEGKDGDDASDAEPPPPPKKTGKGGKKGGKKGAGKKPKKK